MNLKEAAYRIAMKHIEAIPWEEKLPPGKITPKHEEDFDKILDMVNTKKVTNAQKFYDLLSGVHIDKVMLRDLVTRVIQKGKSEEIVKTVFLLGEGKPMGDSSPSKGLKILSESWVKGQMDDGELTRKIKPKFWPLFRDKEWLAKESQVTDKKDTKPKEESWTTKTKREVEQEKQKKV